MSLDAENITDTAILWLREDRIAEGASEDDIGATWVAMHDQPTPIRAIYAARQRCADILNARVARGVQPRRAGEPREELVEVVARLQRLRRAAKTARAAKAAEGPQTDEAAMTARSLLTWEEWQLVFQLRCRSKQGQTISGDDNALLHRAFRADPERYSALEADVFNATVPVGSNVRRDK